MLKSVKLDPRGVKFMKKCKIEVEKCKIGFPGCKIDEKRIKLSPRGAKLDPAPAKSTKHPTPTAARRYVDIAIEVLVHDLTARRLLDLG